MSQLDTHPEGKPRYTAAKMLSAKTAREWLAAYHAQGHEQTALMLIGIKDLKQINERLGRTAGDAVMNDIGNRISQFGATRISDLLITARMPGREFLLVFGGGYTEKQVELLAGDLLENLSSNLGDPSEPLHISTRIGIALAHHNEAGTGLLHRAGAALAQAYGRKGKRLAFAEFEGTPEPGIAAAIDAGMRAAIANRQIAIVLQPQFEVATGRLVGAEALARLHHADLGEVGAGDLFAAADRCDLREELSYLIQEEAIAIAARWPAALDELRLSVNLGAEELREGYSAELLQILAHTGFTAQRLTLELTEESLVRDIDIASEQLAILRTQHIRIAVDDFGTGYSSLAYLKTLPLDYLKIDKGMTPDISGTGKDRIVLRAIIAMAKALDLKIIAEGVEREEELAMLQAEGCDYFQGYLRSAPLSPIDFERFALRSN